MTTKFQANPLYPKELIIFNGSSWKISLWENQYFLGRASLEYRDESVRHLRDLPKEHSSEMIDLINMYEHALVKAFNTTNFNWTCLMNASYRIKPEPLHLHCWPRYKTPVYFNGIEFKDEIFANHYDESLEKTVDEEMLKKIATVILENF